MDNIRESLSKLPLDNLKNMKRSFRWIYEQDPSNDNLDNMIIVEQAISLKLEDAGGGGGVATANAGNVSGMGNVVAAQPGSIPGTTGTTGSGDVGVSLFSPQIQQPVGLGKLFAKIKKSKKLMKKLKGKKLLSYNDFLSKSK